MGGYSPARAGQAMTDGDANGLLTHRETKLSTTTGGGTKGRMCCAIHSWPFTMVDEARIIHTKPTPPAQ
jgi:hypothetical protein